MPRGWTAAICPAIEKHALTKRVGGRRLGPDRLEGGSGRSGAVQGGRGGGAMAHCMAYTLAALAAALRVPSWASAWSHSGSVFPSSLKIRTPGTTATVAPVEQQLGDRGRSSMFDLAPCAGFPLPAPSSRGPCVQANLAVRKKQLDRHAGPSYQCETTPQRPNRSGGDFAMAPQSARSPTFRKILSLSL